MRRLTIGIVAVVALAAAGCASMDSGSMQKSLYDRLGCKPAITAVPAKPTATATRPCFAKPSTY